MLRRSFLKAALLGLSLAGTRLGLSEELPSVDERPVLDEEYPDPSAASLFSDFIAAAGPVYLDSPEEFLRETVRPKYALERMMRGRR